MLKRRMGDKMEDCEAELLSLCSDLSLNHVKQEVENSEMFLLHSAPPPDLNDQAGEKRSLSPLFVPAVGVGAVCLLRQGLQIMGLLKFS